MSNDVDAARVEPVVMRLFVWEGFCPDYTDGLAFAVAETVEQAQELVTKAKGYDPFEWGTLKELDLSSPIAFAVSGGG
jgi:hypothetical protein